MSFQTEGEIRLNYKTDFSIFYFKNIKIFRLGFHAERDFYFTFNIAELIQLLDWAKTARVDSSIVIERNIFSLKEFFHSKKPPTIEFVVCSATINNNSINNNSVISKQRSVKIDNLPEVIDYLENFILSIKNFEIMS